MAAGASHRHQGFGLNRGRAHDSEYIWNHDEPFPLIHSNNGTQLHSNFSRPQPDPEFDLSLQRFGTAATHNSNDGQGSWTSPTTVSDQRMTERHVSVAPVPTHGINFDFNSGGQPHAFNQTEIPRYAPAGANPYTTQQPLAPGANVMQTNVSVADVPTSGMCFDFNSGGQPHAFNQTEIPRYAPAGANPYTTQQPLAPDTNMIQTSDFDGRSPGPDSGSSMSLESNPWVDLSQPGYNHCPDLNGMSMDQTEAPWSMVNMRITEPRQAPLIPETIEPLLLQNYYTSSIYSCSVDDGSSVPNDDPATSENTFNTEVDEMVNSTSTIRPDRTEEQVSTNPMSPMNYSLPERGSYPYISDLEQRAGFRFFLRPDTPSQGVAAQQGGDTMVVVDRRENLSVPATASEVSSPSSGTSYMNAHSPMSATSSSVPAVLPCDVVGCSAEFHGKYRKGNLGRHRRMKHTGGTPVGFVCEDHLCPRSFKRKDARLKHYRNHHPALAADPISRSFLPGR
ncbi:hypothetical protein EJ07DRAFT_151295 [Lizonia empirigonia]|nr:hypothetical protein EJ07DRAFT_151295 [Lizonia empirigonia]